MIDHQSINQPTNISIKISLVTADTVPVPGLTVEGVGAVKVSDEELHWRAAQAELLGPRQRLQHPPIDAHRWPVQRGGLHQADTLLGERLHPDAELLVPDLFLQELGGRRGILLMVVAAFLGAGSSGQQAGQPAGDGLGW